MFAWTLLMLALCVRSLPETLPVSQRHALRPAVLWRNYRAVLEQPRFALLALVPALNFCAFFVYISAAQSFLVGLLGVSTYGFAWLFLPMISGIMLGALMSGRLAGRLSPPRTVRIGFTVAAAGVVLNLLICAFLPPFVLWNVLPLFVFTCGSSLIMPTITLLLLDLFPTMRGMTSSLQGFVQFALGGVVAGTIAPLLAHSLTALALGMAAFTGTSFVLWLVYQHRTRTKEALP
jgi:DHA1 family bicyclomycin/chloramphenicol resistance-like MFS transporter